MTQGKIPVHETRLRWELGLLCSGALVTTAAAQEGGGGVHGDGDRAELVDAMHQPVAEHADQLVFFTMAEGDRYEDVFELAFELGDELFETTFNALDGVGVNVGGGQRFTRVPRADLAGPNEWASHVPSRATGPNAESCSACHNLPFDDGAGAASANVHRDPLHRGPASFIQRNTPHLFAPGAVQRLAEEMTATLHGLRARAAAEAALTGQPETRALGAKGVSFGRITALPGGGFDTSLVQGVSADLIVRPFQWKGSIGTLRAFNRDAAHNELGMQAMEFVGDHADADGDGVAGELTVGDLTALTVYLAAQPRPTSLLELSDLGLLDPPLSRAEKLGIRRGFTAFSEVGCASCHVPRMHLDDPVFYEPSRLDAYREASFPAGQDPLALGVDPEYAVRFDLTADQPDNRIVTADGALVRLGSLARDPTGAVAVDLFGDLKRHDMGRGLAEAIDEVGTGASVFLTENLWGVGSTAPYMHDGRATTLTEAILAHGGEARLAKDAFFLLPMSRQQDVIAFLQSLVLFKVEEGRAVRPLRHGEESRRPPASD